ncbi:indole-3-glycerol-phosphate synthase [Desulfovibrionales bacterium]
MLERFHLAKQAEINALLRKQDQGHVFTPWSLSRPDFSAALTHPHATGIIAEYKRASPSKGNINLHSSALDVCTAYLNAGASALSILTESTYFKGDLAYLTEVHNLGLPLLRKDFIIHPLQVVATRTTPASAILLIARMFKDQTELGDMHRLCLGIGLEPVVEIFDKNDLARAKEIKARIIQVNNRDLDTLTTDLNRSLELVRYKEAEEIWIGASGISSTDQVQMLKSAGLNALLIGTALMNAQNPGQGLTALTSTQRRQV